MIVLRAALAHRQYVMARPPLGEFRTHRVQAVHQLDKMRIAGITGGSHELIVRAADFQETKNMENVGPVLPNTRTLKKTVAVR